PGTVVLDDDVGRLGHPLDEGDALLGPQVDGDRPLAVVVGDEGLAVDVRRLVGHPDGARGVAVGHRLDLDDVGAEVAHDRRRVRAGQVPGEVEHSYAGKWSL